MKLKSLNILLILSGVLLGISCWSQAQSTKKSISIKVPSIDQEATSIWRTINDINFLEQQGYKINLPKDDLIDSLLVKSKKGNFGNDDFSPIYNLLESKIYNNSNYKKALEKVQNQEQLINDIIHQINLSKRNWTWDFKMFESYDVVFTLYGSGGSYDPDNGTVTLFTTLEGDFMNYKKPANTIIHEIVHMGIEESIIRKYNLPHGLKERIVDTIVYILFKKQLPNYKIQNMGDTRIDDYLKEKNDLNKLTSILEKYLKLK